MRSLRCLAPSLSFVLATGWLLAQPASAAPPDWTCDALVAEDDVCDCGCGVPDPACDADNLLACEVEHCDVDRTFPSPLDPAQCTTLEDMLEEVFNFDPSSIDIPEEFLCAPWWIDAEDGCDCGCGVPDPDCAATTADACDANACAAVGLELDASDATQCAFPEDFGLFDLIGLSGQLCEESDESEPNASEPDASEPDANEPDASEPDANEPDASEPDASEPDASEPDASEPDASEPDASDVDGGSLGEGNDDFTYAPGASDPTDPPADDTVAPLEDASGCANVGTDGSLLAMVLLWGLMLMRRRQSQF